MPERLEENAIFAEVMNYGQHAIEYSVRIWTTSNDYWTAKFEIQRRVKAIFDRDGLQMTYPHVNVHIVQK